MERILDDSRVLITGGTGSFGTRFLERILRTNASEVLVFSRDEAKQAQLEDNFADSRIRFVIGDIRDAKSLERATRGVNLVFHAAALKQVPAGENSPEEFILTNALGTQNLIDASISNGVRKIVALSTDKAVKPTSAMGMTKALMEKIIVARSEEAKNAGLDLITTRFGNVVSSRGSVIPKFADQIITGSPVTVTDPKMTRFLMTLDDATDLVLSAMEHGIHGQLFVKKSNSYNILALAETIATILGRPGHPITFTGLRKGESLDESLLSFEELAYASEADGFITISQQRYDKSGALRRPQSHLESYVSSSVSALTEFEAIRDLLVSDRDFLKTLRSVDCHLPSSSESMENSR